MSRGRIAFVVLSLVLVVPIVAASFVRASPTEGEAPEVGEDSLYKYLGVFTEVLSLVRQTYVDETDLNALMANALDGSTDALDPFSLYVPATEVSRYLDARRVGVQHSGLHLLKEHGVAFVIAVDQGSPAEKAGVKVGDILAELDGRDTRTMPLRGSGAPAAPPSFPTTKVRLFRRERMSTCPPVRRRPSTCNPSARAVRWMGPCSVLVSPVSITRASGPSERTSTDGASCTSKTRTDSAEADCAQTRTRSAMTPTPTKLTTRCGISGERAMKGYTTRRSAEG